MFMVLTDCTSLQNSLVGLEDSPCKGLEMPSRELAWPTIKISPEQRKEKHKGNH